MNKGQDLNFFRFTSIFLNLAQRSSENKQIIHGLTIFQICFKDQATFLVINYVNQVNQEYYDGSKMLLPLVLWSITDNKSHDVNSVGGSELARKVSCWPAAVCENIPIQRL